MGGGRGSRKRTYISLSSSSSGDNKEDQSEEELDSELESEETDRNDDHDFDEAEETGPSASCDDDDDVDATGCEWSDDEGDESDDQEEAEDESSGLHDDESLRNRVLRLLRGKSDLQELNLRECKSYLRQHALRITGTKAECIQRIMEHWRMRDGNAEALYPRSSFSINCTGDVCKGDVVLFTQRVFKKFDKVSRRGSIIGKRTTAGRVVKESYGAAKQQHTFTIEVLWSKGIKKLPPLFPLLVKGRNLYKLKTFRQPWKNETERLRVLAEKHKRGAAARLARAERKTKTEYYKKGFKRQKEFHHSRPSQMGKKTEPKKAKDGAGLGKAPMKHVEGDSYHQKAPPFGRANSQKYPRSRVLKSSTKYQSFSDPYKNSGLRTNSYAYPPQNFYQFERAQLMDHLPVAPFRLPSCGTGSTSRFPQFSPYLDPSLTPTSQFQGQNHLPHPQHLYYTRPNHAFEPRGFNGPPELRNDYALSRPFSLGKETYRQRGDFSAL
ncbi:zinc finger CCCH domain-containing protein 62 [Diospyros lotus]|uniref:zinc finger CCCH domain-containing protein 62 n=1 Tax=Diospyros lotus TaxID=55363 RepID=UPI0022595695|nr:zinc finger CCCH domain-containing protein 62 [Diospyros lotus]